MTNTNDYISTLTVDAETITEVTEENYKGLLKYFEFTLMGAEYDIEILKERYNDLLEMWKNHYCRTWEEVEKLGAKATEYETQIKENKEVAKKAMHTIDIIKLFAKIKGWK